MSTEVTITLGPQSEKLAQENPLGLSPAPLYHQMRTYEALGRADLVINTYNTGTGKTRAALLHLLRMPAKADHNVLFIAPTNELVRQHQTDVVKFVQEQALDWYVLPPIDAEELRGLRDRERAETDEHARNSRVLHDIIGNPRACFPKADTRKPFVMVTNPDLFYYCLYHCSQGGELDARNLFQDMLCRFDYIVIDEFHYYDPKQFANFLFFLTLLRRLGHFDGTKRVCLLSATPSASVRTYFQRLADLKPVVADQVPFRFEEVRPDNEPEEAAGCATLPALSPLRLTLVPDPMDLAARVQADAESIRKRLADGEEGVILSGSMARIADIQSALRNVRMTDEHMGAITGAAGRAERERAKQKPLILATPTVDIGYNFERSKKEWQSIEFLYGDARNAAELLQRIGRAGRVLGKKVTDHLSEATMCVPGSLRDAIFKSGKTEWDRSEFAQVARESMTAPSWAEAYLNSWALLEAYQPLRAFEQTLPQMDVPLIQEIFADIKAVFAPDSGVTPERLNGKIRAFQDRKTLQQAAQYNRWDDFSQRLLEKAAYGFCYRRFWENNEPAKAAQLAALPAIQRRAKIQGMLRSGKNRHAVLEYAEAGYQRMRSLLTFRGGGIDLECGVFDPDRLLPSGATDTRYDLLHLLQNYDVQIPVVSLNCLDGPSQIPGRVFASRTRFPGSPRRPDTTAVLLLSR
ncbi:MAG: Type CRISPR-associated helicase Cas3, partial [Chthonomonadales bacterium]|nr:Type CRISPR-associated helicase Cas3 [Chthonomonadales bacterium]